MTKETQSFVDIVRQFGSDLGLPKVDADKLVETHRKNFEALTQTALVASDGMKSVATKQKEMIESAFREALDMARNFKPSGDPQQILRQAERIGAQGVRCGDRPYEADCRPGQQVAGRGAQDRQRQNRGEHRRASREFEQAGGAKQAEDLNAGCQSRRDTL